LTLLPAAVTPEQVADACGERPGWVCERVLEWSGDESLAEIAGWAVDRPLRILLILLGALIVARLARRAVRGALTRLSTTAVDRRIEGISELAPDAAAERQAIITRSAQRVDAASAVLQSGIAFLVFLVALLMVLGEIGISLAPLIAGAGVAGLAIGFGAQTLVRDFLSGLFILLEDQYAVGDIVDLGEASGVVEHVSLRTTRLRAVDGIVWHIPNGEITRVGNMSQHWSRSLLDIEVAYDTDLPKAKQLIGDVARSYAEADDDVLGEPEVWGVEALAASGIVIRLVVKTLPSAQWRVSRELRERIKDAFDRAGIEIPFPQQTVWMRPGGGEGGRAEGAPPAPEQQQGREQEGQGA
jgi:moderate conductance mechanosensitive channel